MSIEAKVIKDSISRLGNRVTTLQLKYHRFIHGEFMTHRVFSRNASSSRAIPVMKMLKQVWNDPAMPVHWGQNQPGMQAKTQLKGIKLEIAKALWRGAAKAACVFAYLMMKLGVHKQIANRVLEPFQWIHVICTSTEWQNFFDLRYHEDAQPEIQELAKQIFMAMAQSTPILRQRGDTTDGYHLPYIEDGDVIFYGIDTALKMSSARCARVSYLTHDGKVPELSRDIKLHDDLVGSVPIHASPTEHPCRVADDNDFHKNFRGWHQYREIVEQKIKEKKIEHA